MLTFLFYSFVSVVKGLLRDGLTKTLFEHLWVEAAGETAGQMVNYCAMIFFFLLIWFYVIGFGFFKIYFALLSLNFDIDR